MIELLLSAKYILSPVRYIIIGLPLDRDLSFSFRTPLLRLTSHFPFFSRTTKFDLEPLLFIHFNQKINSERIVASSNRNLLRITWEDWDKDKVNTNNDNNIEYRLATLDDRVRSSKEIQSCLASAKEGTIVFITHLSNRIYVSLLFFPAVVLNSFIHLSYRMLASFTNNQTTPEEQTRQINGRQGNSLKRRRACSRQTSLLLFLDIRRF